MSGQTALLHRPEVIARTLAFSADVWIVTVRQQFLLRATFWSSECLIDRA
jgi:hypothetical protein